MIILVKKAQHVFSVFVIDFQSISNVVHSALLHLFFRMRKTECLANKFHFEFLRSFHKKCSSLWKRSVSYFVVSQEKPEKHSFTSYWILPFPENIYLLKVSNRNSRTWCEVYSTSTIKTPKRRHWSYFVVFVINLEQISLYTLNKYQLDPSNKTCSKSTKEKFEKGAKRV